MAVLQAAYAAYSAIANQAATVVGAMDKVWSGGGGLESGNGQGGGNSESGTASAQEQQARLAVALQNSQDGDEVYVQVSHLGHIKPLRALASTQPPCVSPDVQEQPA